MSILADTSKGRLFSIAAPRMICGILLLLQACILDYYTHQTSSILFAIWILIDIGLSVIFGATLFMSFRRFIAVGDKDEALPSHMLYGLATWILYILALVTRIAFIFAHHLQINHPGGGSLLTLALSLTCPIYLLYIESLHDAEVGTSRRKTISLFTGFMWIELLDAGDLLGMLSSIVSGSITGAMGNAVIAFACIDLLCAIVPIIILTKLKYCHLYVPAKLRTICSVFLTLVCNVPAFFIRISIWFSFGQRVSVFLIKNILMTVWIIREWILYSDHMTMDVSSSVVQTSNIPRTQQNKTDHQESRRKAEVVKHPIREEQTNIPTVSQVTTRTDREYSEISYPPQHLFPDGVTPV